MNNDHLLQLNSSEKKKQFTFCSFTYNQQDLIIQQLESIKYQIERYGQNVECSYLLCDDHSSDKTVHTVESWLNSNKELFSDINIVVQGKNGGIVNNFTSALRNIKTEYFKILAGDDFYFKNNIFDIYRNGNMIISPLIHYDTNCSVLSGDYIFIRRLIMSGNSNEKIKQFAIRQYKYGPAGLWAPGVFITRDLVDQGLFDALSPYKWIEDVPEFNYLIRQEKTKIDIINKPVVVYRTDSGVSHKENIPKSSRFEKDNLKLAENIHTRMITTPKPLCPFYYVKGLDCALNKVAGLTIRKRGQRLREFDETVAREKTEAKAYIDYIMEKAGMFAGRLAEE